MLSAKNRLFRLLTSETLGRFLNSSAGSINLEEIIEKGKILLVNLAPSKHLSDENGRVFGALLVNEFFEVARMMAQELFIREFDPLRIKVAIYQTKFWPKYSRDRVYTKSSSSGHSSGTGENTVSGESSSSTEGQFFDATQWNMGGLVGTSVVWSE
jgi:hypothetical protein